MFDLSARDKLNKALPDYPYIVNAIFDIPYIEFGISKLFVSSSFPFSGFVSFVRDIDGAFCRFCLRKKAGRFDGYKATVKHTEETKRRLSAFEQTIKG